MTRAFRVSTDGSFARMSPPVRMAAIAVLVLVALLCIHVASALHPQTLLTFKISDEILPPRYGDPVKLRVATKLGFKNSEWITAMFVTNRFPSGFWEDRGI